MSNMIMFYVPCPSLAEAKRIARALVEKRYIACANIFNNCTSIYEYDGRLFEENEVILIMKTMKSLYLEVEKEISERHPYECPCIVALDTAEANMPFAKWVDSQTLAEI